MKASTVSLGYQSCASRRGYVFRYGLNWIGLVDAFFPIASSMPWDLEDCRSDRSIIIQDKDE